MATKQNFDKTVVLIQCMEIAVSFGEEENV
jgi:hypothetical protein